MTIVVVRLSRTEGRWDKHQSVQVEEGEVDVNNEEQEGQQSNKGENTMSRKIGIRRRK